MIGRGKGLVFRMTAGALLVSLLWPAAPARALVWPGQAGWFSWARPVGTYSLAGGFAGGGVWRRVIVYRVPASAAPGASAPVPARSAAPAPAPVPAAPGPVPAAGLTPDEQRMVDLVNRARAAQGIAPLAVDMRLVETARLKSRDMVEKGYFGHVSPTYGTIADMWRRAGIGFAAGGENIAGAPTVDVAFNNLMNSPGHRANILNPAFTHIGVGIVDGGPYGKMITQQFITAR